MGYNRRRLYRLKGCLVTKLSNSLYVSIIIIIIIIIVNVNALLRKSLLTFLNLVRNVLTYILEVYLLLDLGPYGVECVLKSLIKVYNNYA